MNGSFGRTYRGMQVHAVPEHERAYDTQNGKKLPWGYVAAANIGPDGENDRGRDHVEKGPFGRSLRRARGGTSRSRSKTAEPSKEADRIRAEQLAAEEAVFGSLRKIPKEDSRREALGEVDGNAVPTPSQNVQAVEEKEPTEVLLYGFGNELQWSAIDFYERVSDGIILEDYERAPPGQRGVDISRSYGRVAAQRSLGRTALRKKNRFAGGDHWIKVTFDSRQAAELACAMSPHIIRGHLVYAEPFQGRGPGRDEPIYASQAGVQITSEQLPPTFSTQNASPHSSTTITSATAAASGTLQGSPDSSKTQTTVAAQDKGGVVVEQIRTSGLSLGQQSQAVQQRRGRLEGAIPATVYSAEQAFMPKQPKQSWFASFGASEMIGSTVPTTDDGKFDWAKASLYWCIAFYIDLLLGSNICGLRGGD